MNRTRLILAALAFAGYVLTVVAANWAVAQWPGGVDILPGRPVLLAPAAVYTVGAALVLRDLLHEAAGRWWRWVVFAAIGVGAGLSWATTNVPAGELGGPVSLAVASGAAFAVSELVDLAVFVAVRPRTRALAPAALVSSLPSLVVDSLVFLWLAFGSLGFLRGQLVGKTLAVCAGVVLVAAIDVARVRRADRVPAVPA